MTHVWKMCVHVSTLYHYFLNKFPRVEYGLTHTAGMVTLVSFPTPCLRSLISLHPRQHNHPFKFLPNW